jgi:hypothetical protein
LFDVNATSRIQIVFRPPRFSASRPGRAGNRFFNPVGIAKTTDKAPNSGGGKAQAESRLPNLDESRRSAGLLRCGQYIPLLRQFSALIAFQVRQVVIKT